MPIKNLVPLQKNSSFHSVIFRIEELLRGGTLKPGEKLPPETQLAEMLKVSRPTVREALKALNLLGFLTSRSGDGTYVADGGRDLLKRAVYFSALLSSQDFLGLIEARIAIEPFLAEMAALRATRSELARMQECLAHMEAGLGDMDKYLGHEVAFHDQIIKAARSPILQAIMESLRDLLLEGRIKITAVMTDRRNLEFHIRIFEAIAKKDSELARQRMLEHLLDNRERYEAFYKTFGIRNFSRASFFPHLMVPSVSSHSGRRAK
ncbi:MAG: FadR/GntR family transcriptional regulator [Terriglobia bacterium]